MSADGSSCVEPSSVAPGGPCVRSENCAPVSGATVTCSADGLCSFECVAPNVLEQDGGSAVCMPRCGAVDVHRASADSGHAYVLSVFALGGDSASQPDDSRVRLYEDGVLLGPGHSSLDQVRKLGGGRFSHSGDALYFSTSDDSDPRANGRVYTWGVGSSDSCPAALCGSIDPAQVVLETGHSFVVPNHNFGFKGDTLDAPTRSSLRLFEDDVELGPAHSLHADIRALGGGRFSHWGNALYFSATDDSDPRSNGRSYVFGGDCRLIQTVKAQRLAAGVPSFATFQSHNQKVVENAHGIFLSYWSHIDPGPSWPGNALDSPGEWRLVRSADFGETFQDVYVGANTFTRAPAIETDLDDNVYAFEQHFTAVTGEDAYLLEFDAASGFGAPQRTTLPKGADEKYAALFDPTKSRLYFTGAYSKLFWSLEPNGTIESTQTLFADGPNAFLIYPQLRRDGDALFYAWTTQKHGVYLYWDIHFMMSMDGGATWTRTDGTPLVPPIVVDDTGPAQGIVPASELAGHTWLSSFFARGNFLHFFYLYEGAPSAEHYVRWNRASNAIDINQTPIWGGQALQIANLDGFFTSKADPAGLIYAVSKDGRTHRIVVLASDDDGESWFDYAASRPFVLPYSIGGSRTIGPSGKIIGTFTDALANDGTPNGAEVWFFHVPAE